MAIYSCADCKWLHEIEDNSKRTTYICVFDLSDNYLQEVVLYTEDCELDDFAEEVYRKNNTGGIWGNDT